MSKGMSGAGWGFFGLAAIAALFYLQIAADAQRDHTRHLTTCTNKVNSLEAEVKIQKSLVTEARLAANHYEREWKRSETNFTNTLALAQLAYDGLVVITNQIQSLKGDVERVVAERDEYLGQINALREETMNARSNAFLWQNRYDGATNAHHGWVEAAKARIERLEHANYNKQK